ncbi:MAG: hypothetical protein ABIU54_11650 [Candidatus Eisenbacteria bacterium]
MELRLEPRAPEGLKVNYWVMMSRSGIGLIPPPVYRAPYVIPPGTPPVKVNASFSGLTVQGDASTEIELLPGSMSGAEDCLGPGQSFSTILGEIEPRYARLDVLPQLIHTVEPEYPRSEFVRGVEDTIPMQSLVCRSGRVLDAYVLQRYRGTTTLQPIENDPKLVEAALAAARQYIYSPGMVLGHAVAVWVVTQVIIRR